jgi:hypothetical protein
MKQTTTDDSKGLKLRSLFSASTHCFINGMSLSYGYVLVSSSREGGRINIYV